MVIYSKGARHVQMDEPIGWALRLYSRYFLSVCFYAKDGNQWRAHLLRTREEFILSPAVNSASASVRRRSLLLDLIFISRVRQPSTAVHCAR